MAYQRTVLQRGTETKRKERRERNRLRAKLTN